MITSQDNNPKIDTDAFTEAWHSTPDAPQDVPMDEFWGQGSERAALSDSLSEGEQYAENKAAALIGVKPTKGLSRQTLKYEAEEESENNLAADQRIHNNPGKDDQLTLDWKARNKARQDQELKDLQQKLRPKPKKGVL